MQKISRVEAGGLIFFKNKLKLMKNKYPYYVNTERNDGFGNYRLHVDGCVHMPDINRRKTIGLFQEHKAAFEKAKETYPDIRPCLLCTWED